MSADQTDTAAYKENTFPSCSFLKTVYMELTCSYLSTPEERFLALLGVIGIVLNLLLLLFVYVYTAI